MIRKVLIVGYVWPEPKSSAAGIRMLELVQLFLHMQCEITFASAAVLSEHRFDLASLGVVEKPIALNCSSFDRFVEHFQPDLVLFDRFFTEEQFGWRVARAWPQALRVLDTEDLHSLRHTRQQLLKASQKRFSTEKEKQSVGPISAGADDLFRHMCSQDMALREVAAIFRCDLSLMISEFEIELLQYYFAVPAQLLFYSPFLTPTNVHESTLPDFAARRHFVTIGNFRHEPNWDSALWLKHHLWPLIRMQLPTAELHVYGAYPPPKATQLHKPADGFCVRGWTEDASQVMRQARVCLAPLRFGAGIKGKLMDAMRCGTPSVTTNIGAEAMSGGFAWGGAVADDAAGFAAAAVHLYQDPLAWENAQQNGFFILQHFFHRANHAQLLNERIQSLIINLEQQRRANFIGQMLRHHHLRSTQYMGQWIEAKNKR